MSDLHIDYSPYTYSFDPDKGQDIVLLLAGDICEIDSIDTYSDFLRKVSKIYKEVVLVLGNHSYYHGSIDTSAKIISSKISDIENIHILNNDVHVIDDVTIIGTTLWTDMDRGNPLAMLCAKDQIQDFRLIKKDEKRKLLPQDVVELFHKNVKFIAESLDNKTTDKVIVMTHHAPSYQSVTERYRNDPLNPAFCSNLDDFIYYNNINLWIHGHVHSSHDYYIGNTRIVCNPRGYGMENRKFNPDLIIEL